MIWSRTDRPSRMWVDWSLEESFARRVRVPGPNALADTDFTARLDLSDLPPGEQVFYRVTFEDLANPGTMSQSATGGCAPRRSAGATSASSSRAMRRARAGASIPSGAAIASMRRCER
jgi:Phosphodiesterase/alkaline phosphatase D